MSLRLSSPRSSPPRPLALVSNASAGSSVSAAELEERFLDEGAAIATYDHVGEIPSEIERIVVAGGDGTVRVAAARASAAGVPLAVIPTGTANDFASRMGLPADLEEACRIAALGSQLRHIDLAWIEDEPFVNVANVGLPATAARAARPFKDFLGRAGYALGAARSMFSASPIELRLSSAGKTVLAGSVWQLTIANSGAFGAGLHADPADPSDGMLDVLVMKKSKRFRMLGHGYALRFGDVRRRSGIERYSGVEFEVLLPGGASVNVDGDLVEFEHAHVRLGRAGFQLVVA